jgi:phosphoenolpyruvate carboxylase
MVDGEVRDASASEAEELEALRAQINKALVPQSVAMWQARYVLIEDDLLDDVLGYLAAIPDEKTRKLAQAKFEYSSTVRRDEPLVTTVLPALGKTEDEIDQLFVRASQL